MYRRILVPVDGSPAAAAGLDEAIRLAALAHAEICLLHLVEPLPALQGMEVLVERQVRRNLEDFGRKVLSAARAAAERKGLRVRAVLRRNPRGRVADGIVREADRRRADLIVMGTHGRRGIARLVLGSDAERVAASAAMPVVLVASRAAAARRP